MSDTITVTFYKKTYSHCSACDAMASVLQRWIDSHPEVKIKVFTLSIEDNMDRIQTYFPNARQAPVVVIDRSRGGDVDRSWTSGNNPDILVDMLNGDQDIWDEL